MSMDGSYYTQEEENPDSEFICAWKSYARPSDLASDGLMNDPLSRVESGLPSSIVSGADGVFRVLIVRVCTLVRYPGIYLHVSCAC